MLTAAGHRIGVRSLAEQLRVARNRLCAVANFMVASRGDDGLAKVVCNPKRLRERGCANKTIASHLHPPSDECVTGPHKHISNA